MHCYNPDFSDIAILPPYNNLWAQVIKMGGEHPQVVTTGLKVSYTFPNNTFSAGKAGFQNKTNFWDYSEKLFGAKLAVNVGLKGKGLSGDMDLVSNHFLAEGIPLTEYTDQTAQNANKAQWVRDPFQLAIITVTNITTGTLLARTEVVAPVSSEMDCYTCHSDTGDATKRYPITPTGNVNQNILALHDYLNAQTFQQRSLPALMSSKPVMCGSCHSDNALGTAGISGVKSLSNAMHGHHASANITDITPNNDGCYNCHPGPQTQCLRDAMSQMQGMGCLNCHGPISQVATNPNPWLNEPRCDSSSCHGSVATQTDALYRHSVGLGGIYCEGCHDSTHAIAPSREAVDGLKFMLLQGSPSYLSKCSTCHTGTVENEFPHLYNADR